MQRADRSVCIPGAFAAVLLKHFCQRVGVLGQVFKRHGAVFNEADRLAVALEAHHDIEARLAHFPEVFLRRVVHHFDHGAGQTQLAHELDQLAHPGQQVGLGGT